MKNLMMVSTMASMGMLLTACGGGGGGGGSAEVPSFVSCVGDVCTLTGTIDQDYTLDDSKSWQIDGVVKVGNGNVELPTAADVTAAKAAGVTLVIPAGTNVKAFDDATLLVTRGSRLIADGTASQPITFSSLDDNFTGEGEWGGIVIQGFAPQYGKTDTGPCFGSGTVCNVVGEGGDFIGRFGGNDPADDSGVLRYVRIAEGGKIAGPNNEVNGLTLQGVGYGTEIDYLQVHGNLDDGIEWFGGTVNAKHLVLTNNDDDDLDYDEGYKGNIQYAIVVKNQTKAAPSGSNDPRAIEANSGSADYVQATDAALANLTLVGGTVNNATGLEQPGMKLRGSVKTKIYNSAAKGFVKGCVDIDDPSAPGVASAITLVNLLADCAVQTKLYADSRVADTATNAVNSTVTLNAAFALTETAATLGSAPTMTAVSNGSGFAFTATSYVGAVAPGTAAASAWWAGWTIPGSLTLAP